MHEESVDTLTIGEEGAPPSAPVGATRRVQIANFVLFQVAWFAAVLGAADRWPALGATFVLAAVAVHVSMAARPRTELAFVAIVVVVGFLAESAVAMQGHIVYPSGQPVAWLAPYWIVALWGLLATAPNVTLRWLKRRPALAAVLGAICGPASFLAGVRLGGARFVDATPALLTLSIMWAVLMPTLMVLSIKLDGFAARPARP